MQTSPVSRERHHGSESLTLASSIALGALSIPLFDGAHWGANLGIFAVLIWAAQSIRGFCMDQGLAPSSSILAASSVGWTASFAWRDSEWLHASAAIALVSTLYFGYLKTHTGTLTRIPLRALWRLIPRALRETSSEPRLLTRTAVASLGRADTNARRHVGGVIRGLLLASPCLVLFGSLLMHADIRFTHLVLRWTEVDAGLLGRALVTFVAGAWISGALLRRRARCSSWPRPNEAASSVSVVLAIGVVEVATLLCVLDLLFLLYLGVQATYLVGGDALVQSTIPLTYAQYARGGFFELVAIAAMVLPILLFADQISRKDRPAGSFAISILSGVMIAVVCLMEASALHRMSLYAQAYGLTNLRTYTTAFMLWLLAVLLWTGFTVLRGASDRFVPGAIAAGLALVAGLHIANPEDLIVRENLARAREGQTLDLDYLLSLSADAVPRMLAERSSLSPRTREELDQRLHGWWTRVTIEDVRAWNHSRARASAALSQTIAERNRDWAAPEGE